MATPETADGLRITWNDNVLRVSGPELPVPEIRITYLEAFCRPGSHARAWGETVFPHETRLLSGPCDGRHLRLESRLDDGVVVTHEITAATDEVNFRLTAHNPTEHESFAHWAQPCIRVGEFAGFGSEPEEYGYIRKCFLFLAGKLVRLPTADWATEARYTPGQVWCPAAVPRADVNPRPLNPVVPSCGLIGCFSRDENWILATAWEPYQELFQGVIQCIHSDFRIGGLRPGERKNIRGKLYVVSGGVDALLARYRRDFPEHEIDR